MYIHTYIYRWIHKHIYIYKYLYVSTYIYIYIYSVFRDIVMSIYIYIYIHTCIYIYTHMDTDPTVFHWILTIVIMGYLVNNMMRLCIKNGDELFKLWRFEWEIVWWERFLIDVVCHTVRQSQLSNIQFIAGGENWAPTLTCFGDNGLNSA